MIIIFKTLFLVIIACGCLFWFFQLLSLPRLIKNIPFLDQLPYTQLTVWPKLSVIIPARNEADTFEGAMKLRLQETYPNIEFILIDDRSTDGTSALIDSAAKDRRVKTIHITELPDGWLGKLNAMHKGVAISQGEWFLFSDADVHVKPGTLQRLISFCENKKIDHIVIIPDLWAKSFLLDISFSVFMRTLFLGGRVWQISDKKSKVSGGAGAFNLVRRTAFEKIKGFESLKLEVVDDLALGQMLKQSGATSAIVNGYDHVGLYFYDSLLHMARGADKSIFSLVGNFSPLRIVLVSIGSLALEASPFLACIPVGIPYLPFVGLCMILTAFIVSISVNVWLKRSILSALFFFPGALMMNFLLLHAGYAGMRKGGIYWRETFYPTKLLKQGKRYKIVL